MQIDELVAFRANDEGDEFVDKIYKVGNYNTTEIRDAGDEIRIYSNKRTPDPNDPTDHEDFTQVVILPKVQYTKIILRTEKHIKEDE